LANHCRLDDAFQEVRSHGSNPRSKIRDRETTGIPPLQIPGRPVTLMLQEEKRVQLAGEYFRDSA